MDKEVIKIIKEYQLEQDIEIAKKQVASFIDSRCLVDGIIDVNEYKPRDSIKRYVEFHIN